MATRPPLGLLGVPSDWTFLDVTLCIIVSRFGGGGTPVFLVATSPHDQGLALVPSNALAHNLRLLMCEVQSIGVVQVDNQVFKVRFGASECSKPIRVEDVLGKLPNGCGRLMLTNNEPLDDSFDLRSLGKRWRVQAVSKQEQVLLLEGRRYQEEELTINGYPIVLSQTENVQNHTGFSVWDGSHYLADFLEQNQQLVQNQRVLELGAGCGLAGLAAAACRATSVRLTDLPQVLPQLQETIHSNPKLQHLLKAQALDWKDPSTPPTIDCDVILVADCVWTLDLVDPLVQVLERLTAPPPPIPEFPALSFSDFDHTTADLCNFDPEADDDEQESPLSSLTDLYARHHTNESSFATLYEPEAPTRRFDSLFSIPSGDLDAPPPYILLSYQRRGLDAHEQFWRRLRVSFETECLATDGPLSIYRVERRV